MAFSYSDKNFTVIGNLCFVHILLDGTKTLYKIPPAIADRMLFNDFTCTYAYHDENESTLSIVGGSTMPNIGFAITRGDKILWDEAGKGYLSFYFPIDSNK